MSAVNFIVNLQTGLLDDGGSHLPVGSFYLAVSLRSTSKQPQWLGLCPDQYPTWKICCTEYLVRDPRDEKEII
jgi:hypothetical protein